MEYSNIELKSPESIMFIKLKRSYALQKVCKEFFIPDCVNKLSGAENFARTYSYTTIQSSILSRINSDFSGLDYLLFFSLFNAFFEAKPKDSFFPFRVGMLNSFNSATKLFYSIKINPPKKLHIFNFIYFLLFFHLPRVINVGADVQLFSSSVNFPDFNMYANHLANFTDKYPHYSAILKKAGLFIFLSDRSIRFNFNASSFILKNTYASSHRIEDWSLKFITYFNFKGNPEYFRLYKSFLKFFVVG